jgi:DNA-binding transcriptional MerR regulator
MEANLTVDQVAKVAGCHRNTVLKYEREGYISPMRDNNNFRRYTLQQALELKKIFEIRRPVND